MTLAIFDLDNTLIGGDSDHAFGEFLVAKQLVCEKTFKETNDYFYQQYQEGKLDIHEYLDFALKPLAEHSLEKLEQLHQEFMKEYIQPIMLDKAFELLAKHRAQGHYLLIITATNDFVTKPIARALGVDDILATEAEIIDGSYTGKVTGTPCFQKGKVTRLNAWLENTDLKLEGSYFYSDSHNDLPLLQMVDNPVAVDADEILFAHAKANSWPTISLR